MLVPHTRNIGIGRSTPGLPPFRSFNHRLLFVLFDTDWNWTTHRLRCQILERHGAQSIFIQNVIKMFQRNLPEETG